MTHTTRRAFLAGTAAAGIGASLYAGASVAAKAVTSVSLSWLDKAPPAVPGGIAWGVPWPRGTVSKTAQMTVRDRSGQPLPTQSWPLAYWPDGSIKWTGLAIAADATTDGLSLEVGKAPSPAPKTPVKVSEDGQSITVTTGPFTARINKAGDSLIASLAIDGREVARDGRLIALREDRSQYDSDGILREDRYGTTVTKITVEQSGPVRAVVRIDGTHSGGGRQWLPFTVRFYFTAGLASVRMVHSFVFDGDQKADFIKGLGLAFAVPFREETQNRHIRFATDGHNLFSEPVLMAPGYKPSAMQNAVQYETAQLAGQRIPNLAQLSDKDRTAIQSTATWDSFKLTQLGPDTWQLYKRTNAKSSWLHVTGGNRARGLAFVGDVSGGLAVSLKRFWQKYPSAFEVTGAATEAAELKVWFWSPDAPAMDLRHYDTVGHGLAVVYEDYQADQANALGGANTSELTLWATPETPSPEKLDALTGTGATPPLLTCSPQHYYDSQAIGYWSLPATPAPGLSADDVASADTQLDRAFTFLNGEIERRKWYGFWDFGDYRRTYDPVRHQWMYDIGGHGFNATELMPNVWLWFAFLRSGRADIFRAAEDMTRNTNEVDVHHIGPLAGLGSRHNVSHWGDSKEARINEAFIKRFYYYLTTDERTGDLMREPIATIEKSIAAFPPLREVVARPDVQPPLAFIRVGPDWLALASNWFAEWERTGDPKWRDYCLTGMKDIGAMADAFLVRDAVIFDPATKHLKDAGAPNQGPTQFLFLFAGDQIVYELMSQIDCPEFVTAWNRMCAQFVDSKRANWYFEPRVTAYTANTTGHADLETRALDLYRNLLHPDGHDYFIANPLAVDGPGVPQPALENPATNTFNKALAVPEVSQWAINLISMPELFRRFKAGVPAK